MKKRRIKFSIPYNGDIDLIRWAVSTGLVYEVYFAGPLDGDFSSKTFKSGDFSIKEIETLLRFCHRERIASNLLINKSVLFFDDVKEIVRNVRRLENLGGLSVITIGDRGIVPYLRDALPKVRLQSSVYLHIDTAYKVKEALKMGITDLCLDVSINRNGEELDRIRDLRKYYPDFTVKLLANHGCYQNCFYSGAHENWQDYGDMLKKFSESKGRYVLGKLIQSHKCIHRPKSLDEEIRRPFIRPEDISFYEKNGWADYIKIGHRIDNSHVLSRKLKAYFKRSYKGNLFDVVLSHRSLMCLNKMFPRNFVAKTTSCRSACEECTYCKKVADFVLRERTGVEKLEAQKNES